MRPAQFRWIAWNREHATRHGCGLLEIEAVVRRPGRGYPRKVDKRKWQAIGRGIGDRVIEVIYLIDEGGEVFVIHAMPLTTRRRRG